MKFKEVLHPEIVLGLRGPEVDIKVYELFRSSTEIIGGKVRVELPAEIVRDAILGLHMGITTLYHRLRPPIYVVSSFLGKALTRIDRNIPVDVIPENFFCYFHFPEGTVSDKEGDIHGAYVWTSTAEKSPFMMSDTKDNERLLIISYINRGQANLGRVIIPLLSDKIENLYSQARDTQIFTIDGKESTFAAEEDVAGQKPLTRLCANLLVYLHSSDPEIMKLKPLDQYTHSQRSRIRKEGDDQNLTKLPIRVLNWGYHKRNYTTDATWVDTYQRWQRHGPGLKQVKFIWVKEHERHYKELNQKDVGLRPSDSTTPRGDGCHPG